MNGDPRHDSTLISVTTDHITDEWVEGRKNNAASELRRATKVMMANQRDAFFAEFETLKADLLDWIKAGNYTKPTVMVWGVGDPTTTAEGAVELFQLFRPFVDNIRLYMINNSGHAPYREYPQEAADAIVAFLHRAANATHK